MITKTGLEMKFQSFDEETGLKANAEICGYASVFNTPDKKGDIVKQGAYAKSLQRIADTNTAVKMLWQHDPQKPIGIWQEVFENDHGLYVKGQILKDVQCGKEALALIKAGAIDGLSIGYRTLSATKDKQGNRCLNELELWEVSLVTFPMLPEARVAPDDGALAQELVSVISKARASLLA